MRTLAVLALSLVPSTVSIAQQPACPATPVVTGLRAPVKATLSQQHNLLVAEAGATANTGRISIVGLPGGERRTLIDGLPSGIAPPDNAPSGPSGLAMRGRSLYLTIGAGDTSLAGPVPGSEIANPHPSSPLFSSVLALHFSAATEWQTTGFTLTREDQQVLAGGAKVTLYDAEGGRLDLELVANFADFVANPRPGLPNLVRSSNPFGLVVSGDSLYVSDASMNNLVRVALNTGATETLVTFPSFPNPGPFGPPMIEPVPDNVRWYGDRLVVPLLTGAPFLPGVASVATVDPVTGTSSPLIGGLTMAIDVLPLDDGRLLTLEFSAAGGAMPPGRLNLYMAPASAPSTLAQCLVTPTSITYDAVESVVYVTQIFTGSVVAVRLQ